MPLLPWCMWCAGRAIPSRHLILSDPPLLLLSSPTLPLQVSVVLLQRDHQPCEEGRGSVTCLHPSVSIARCYHLWAHQAGGRAGKRNCGGCRLGEAGTRGKEISIHCSGAWVPIQTRGPVLLILHLLFFLCTFLYRGNNDCLVYTSVGGWGPEAET